MGGRTSFSFLLVLLCASKGWTQSNSSIKTASTVSSRTASTVSSWNASTVSSWNASTVSSRNASTVSSWNDTKVYNCTQRVGTSLTVLMDAFLAYSNNLYNTESALTQLSARFPCVTRQYTSILLDYKETNETITSDLNTFLKSIRRNYYDYSAYYNDYYHFTACNQSFLYGLKRAVEISPEESIIVAVTAGSMVDYNDTRLLSDVYTLLEKKKSQVYILFSSWGYCSVISSQQDVFNNLSSASYGQFINTAYFNNMKFANSLALLLSKPLNSSVRIMNVNTNVTDKYTKAFNVTNSLTYLLIGGSDTFTLTVTDPKGKTFTFERTPANYYYYYNQMFASYHLVKSSAAGTWTLNAQGNTSLAVRIFGFTRLNISGNCSDSACHPNATCGEFGGDQQCTCKEGFTGDGSYCTDVDECQSYYTNDCYYGYGGSSCVNTIGSYTCNCSSGFEYKKDYGCVDIDECANRTLNDCHPLAVCTNYNYGTYTCTCPYGYYGDGRYCEINECQQGTPCNSSECMKYKGSYSCFDPCSNHTVLNDTWRSTSNVYNYAAYYYTYYSPQCDSYLNGWYRLSTDYGQQMPNYCVPIYSCGTHAPMWLNGSHPTIGEGIVNRTACANWGGDCCLWSNTISVKKCSAGFYVYKLQGTPVCSLAYCMESNNSCSGVTCTADEECKKADRVSGCQCKNSSYITDGIKLGNLSDYITPQVVCGLDSIEVTFNKCLLEKLGYNTSSFHLRDSSCRGFITRKDKTYLTFVTRPINGVCLGEVSHTEDDVTYTNTVYLTPNSDGVNLTKKYPINFHCSYPLSMDINLINSINSLTALATINVAGTLNFTITMGLFQDSGYTTPYTGSEAWLDAYSMLYVGVIVSGSSSSSQFVLLMKNCYATQSTSSTNGLKYDIIKDRCPNRNEPTLSVPENGVSLRGRFALQVFKFVGGIDQIYLHCQIGLCDTYSYNCSARCPLMRADVLDGVNTLQTVTVGPIRQKAAPASSGGSALPTAKLFISGIVLLLLLY